LNKIEIKKKKKYYLEILLAAGRGERGPVKKELVNQIIYERYSHSICTTVPGEWAARIGVTLKSSGRIGSSLKDGRRAQEECK
jgi:hypothetical protein